MSCVLRVSGINLDLGALLQALPIRPYRSWNRGQPYTRHSTNSKIHSDTGACFNVSGAGFDNFEQQQDDALTFLTEHRVALQRLASFPGVEYSQLDFDIELGQAYIHSDVLSLGFLRAAAEACVSVELSHYRPAEDEG